MTDVNVLTLFSLASVIYLVLSFNGNNLEEQNVVNSMEDPMKRKNILEPNLNTFSVPTLTFLICNSWGYKKTFEQYAYAIQHHYPQLKLNADNYPPPPVRVYIAQALVILKFLLIACIISGINPFEKLNIATPNIFLWASQNKIYACLMLFFLTGVIEGQLLSTGAFEVYFNDVPIWSKLESGRPPALEELLDILKNQLKLSTQT